MSEQDDPNRETTGPRREFLRAAFATGSSVAVLAAASGGAVAAVSPSSEPEPPEPDSGYRESQHVRDYYKTAAL